MQEGNSSQSTIVGHSDYAVEYICTITDSSMDIHCQTCLGDSKCNVFVYCDKRDGCCNAVSNTLPLQ